MKNTAILYLTKKKKKDVLSLVGKYFPDTPVLFANEVMEESEPDPGVPRIIVADTADPAVIKLFKEIIGEKQDVWTTALMTDSKDDKTPALPAGLKFDLTFSEGRGAEVLSGFMQYNGQNAPAITDDERKYNTLVDNIPGTIYRCKNDSDWTMLFLSRKMQKISGYPAKDFINNKTRCFSDIILPQDREYIWITVQKALRLKRSFNLEYRIITATGRIKWVWEQGRAVTLANGEMVLEGVIMDIDYRKNLEKRIEIMRDITMALSTTADLTELIDVIKNELLKTIPTGDFFLALYDREKREFRIPYVEKDHEYFRSEPPGKNLNSLVVHRNRTIFLDQREIEKLHRQGKIKLDGPAPKVWLGVPLQTEGKATGIIAVQDFENEHALNETDRDLLEYISVQLTVAILKKQAEDESRKLLQSLDQNPGSVFITDLDGNIVYANKKSTELTGYLMHEITGKKPNIFDPSVNESNMINKIWASLHNSGSWHGEFRNKNKEGNNYWEYARISSIKNHRGKTTHYVHLMEDITQRKQIEKDLIHAKKRAEESDNLKTAFLANMSHEIRTPMNAIIGFTEMLRTDDYSRDEHDQFINLVLENSRKLLSTIDNIIDIAKIQAGQLKIVKSKCSANKILYDNFYSFMKIKEKLDKQHIELVTSQYRENENLLFESDVLHINQVLSNLLDNAFKYTSEGSIELGYTLSTIDGRAYVDFYVKDTGIGIPMDKSEKIFDRFSQGSDNYMNTAGGSGLGLSISRNIALLMGGDIRFTSNSGKGSEFHFLIPYIPVTVGETIDPGKAKPEVKEKFVWPDKTILIAEDEDSNYKLLEIMLRKTKTKLHRAYNGKQALDYLLGGNDADLVLMDVRMPVMNGYEATEHIKKFSPDLPVIIQTAFAMSGDRENSFAAGCDDYLPKPIKATDLYNLLQKHLD